MKILSHIYHFLGGIYFALMLITIVAVMVATGTFLESTTDSHLFASSLTYNNFFFKSLLWGFFINILFSALRRWPFRPRHLPFLLTHFGLLLILGGLLIKSYAGLQGHMVIMEGAGSHEITLPHTYGVMVEHKQIGDRNYFPLRRTLTGKFLTNLTRSANLEIDIAEYMPHAEEKNETWIKKGSGRVNGLPPIPILHQSVGAKAWLTKDTLWNLQAIKSHDPAALAEKLYRERTHICFSDPVTRKNLYKGRLENALNEIISWDGGTIKTFLHFNYSPFSGFSDPFLLLEVQQTGETSLQTVWIPLSGSEALLNKNKTYPHASPPIVADLQRIPSVILIQDLEENIFLFAFDAWGRVHTEPFYQNSLTTLVVYDRGYGGYAVQAEIPFGLPRSSRSEVEKFQLKQVKKRLLAELKNQKSLWPPLQILREACQRSGTNFIRCCLEFLKVGKYSPQWIVNHNFPMSNELQIALSEIRFDEALNACQWIAALSQELEQHVRRGGDFIHFLKARGWPFVEELTYIEPMEFDSLMTLLARQIFAIGAELPQMPSHQFSHATLLSAYFRTFGIHLNNIAFTPYKSSSFFLETSFEKRYIKTDPQLKLENNRPKITLLVREREKKEVVHLLYDPQGQSLKQPALEGQYLFRFQPAMAQIPYHIRVHQARQMNYTGSSQPFSYESDLTITDLRTGFIEEKTISMNHVHETSDGYRFYMASLGASESDVKRVQIAVNYDPAKYWMTYPGAFFVSLGILFLFWMRPYSK